MSANDEELDLELSSDSPEDEMDELLRLIEENEKQQAIQNGEEVPSDLDDVAPLQVVDDSADVADEVSAGEDALEDEGNDESGEDLEAEDTDPEPESLEEIEIDMDDPEAMDILLGLKERPDRPDSVVKRMEREAQENAEAENAEVAEDGPEEEVEEAGEMPSATEDSQPAVSSDMELDDILSQLGEEDDDLKEIGDLLKKSDNHELVEDDVLSLLDETENQNAADDEDADMDLSVENIADADTEAEPEDKKAKKEKKKKEKKARRSKKSDDGEEGAEGEKEKKGLFSKLFAALTEEVPEEEEDPAVAEAKKAKKAKKKRGKKGAVTDAGDNDAILEELDGEPTDKKKGKNSKKDKKKEKKPKKEKKVKEKNTEPEVPSKKLPIKMIIRIFVLCFSILALILIVTNVVPQLWALNDARNAFYKKNYEESYREFVGKKLSKKDEVIFQKAKTITMVEHKYTSYSTYKAMNMPVEALDSLVSGCWLFDDLANDIAELGILEQTQEIKERILNALAADYQLSEDDAREMRQLSRYEYTKKLEETTGSLSIKNKNYESGQSVPVIEEVETEPVAEEESPKEDMILEEME